MQHLSISGGSDDGRDVEALAKCLHDVSCAGVAVREGAMHDLAMKHFSGWARGVDFALPGTPGYSSGIIPQGYRKHDLNLSTSMTSSFSDAIFHRNSRVRDGRCNLRRVARLQAGGKDRQRSDCAVIES